MYIHICIIQYSTEDVIKVWPVVRPFVYTTANVASSILFSTHRNAENLHPVTILKALAASLRVGFCDELKRGF